MKEWITGRNPVYEALRAGRRKIYRLWLAEGAQEKGHLEEALRLARVKKIKPERVPRPQLDKLSPSHQGVALEASEYPYVDLADSLDLAAQRGEPPFLLILDTLQDPQNLGSLLRTAEAVGIHGVLLPFRRSATITPAVVHASSGASEHLLISQTNLAQSITTLKEAGVWVLGLEAGEAATPIGQARLDGSLALVVGNEGEGMRQLVRNSCDLLVGLPTQGKVDSLNAAAAGSIALYLAYLARAKEPGEP